MRLLVVCLFLFLQKCASFFLSPPARMLAYSARQTSRTIMEAKYDAFESDPGMTKLLQEEREKLKVVSTEEIRAKLKQRGNDAYGRDIGVGIFDRADLEVLLAKITVMQRIDANQKKAKYREKLQDEIRRIESCDMSRVDLIQNLQDAKADFDIMGDDEYLINALARHNVMDDNNYKGRRSAGESTAASSPSDIDSAIEGVGQYSKNLAEQFGNWSASITTSRVERVANEILEQDGNVVQGAYWAASEALTEDSMHELLTQMKDLETFDDVVIWARNQPAGTLTAILEHEGVPLPKSSLKSVLYATIADHCMSSKVIESTQTPREKSNTGRSTFNIFRGSQLQKVINPELGILQGISSAGKRTVAAVGNLLTAVGDAEMFNESSDADKGTEGQLSPEDPLLDSPSSVLLNALWTISAIGMRFVARAVKWACADLLPAKNVTFCLAAYCIAFRKGILSFVGPLFILRIVNEFSGSGTKMYLRSKRRATRRRPIKEEAVS